MLQTIREHTQGWIAGIIISIIILSFALWGIHSYFEGGGANTVVAKVNGVEISRELLTVTYERMRRQAQAQYGSAVTTKDEAALKDRALKALIEVQVLQQASLAQSYRISNNQIDNYLESMPEFQVNGQFSVERFQEMIASTMMSTSEFLELIRTSLLISQPKLGIMFSSFALPEETNYTISLVDQERDFSYITIPLQFFMSQPMTISQDKINDYYKQHQAEFMTPEQVNVEYLELSLADLLTTFKPTDVALKNFYNENINAYTQPTSWKLSGILIPVSATASLEEAAQAKEKAEAAVTALRGGADFATVGKQYEAANIVGNSVMTLTQVPTELQQTVAGMNKKDEISDSVRTSRGFVIIKVIEFTAPSIQAFETVKTKVNETWARQHAEEKFAALRDQLADLTYEHPDSLQLAAKTLQMPVKTSELFTKDKGGKDISQQKKVRDMAFSNDVLNLQNNSDVIQLNPETYIVLRVKSHIPSSLLPLKDIAGQIENKLKTKESEIQATAFAEDFKNKLTKGADPQALAAASKFNWVTTGYLGRYSTKVDSAILDMAFRLSQPNATNHKTVYGVTRIPNGYAIVALKDVKPGVATDKKQYAVFAEQVQNSEGLLEYELLKTSEMNAAKVKVYNS